MRKLLLFAALFVPAIAGAQGIAAPPQIVLNTLNGVTRPIANATITVCGPNAIGIPCAPALVGQVWANSALTIAFPGGNPFQTDANGNYQWFALPGQYTVTETALGYAGHSYQVSLSPPTGVAGVSSVGLTVPSWLSVGGTNPITSAGTFAVVPTGAQASHQVIGTCGSGTAFIPCALAQGDLPATSTQTIASGTAALGTAAISSATCATVVTVTATGTATTDDIMADFNADPTGTVGYQPSASGMLTIIKYPTSNNVNFKVCNNTSGSITPGAITLNWRVTR